MFGKKPQLVAFINKESAEKIVKSISLKSTDESISLLKFLRANNADVIETVPGLPGKIDRALKTMDKFKLPEFMVQLPSKRKLGSSAEIRAPKLKKSSTRVFGKSTDSDCIFKRYDEWVPVPFGCPEV